MLQCIHKSTFHLKKEDFIVMGKIVSAVNGYISSHWFTLCRMIAWSESHMLGMCCIQCKTAGVHRGDEQAKSADSWCGDCPWNTHRVTLRWSQHCYSEGKLANRESPSEICLGPKYTYLIRGCSVLVHNIVEKRLGQPLTTAKQRAFRDGTCRLGWLAQLAKQY